MPTISIFVRKDDLPKWQALENKSAWLSQRLNADVKRLDHLNKQLSRLEKAEVDMAVKSSKVQTVKPVIVEYKNEQLCPRHHVPIELCKAKH